MGKFEVWKITLCNFCNFFDNGLLLFIGFTNVLLFIVTFPNRTVYRAFEDILLVILATSLILIVIALRGIIISIFERYLMIAWNKIGRLIVFGLQLFLITFWNSINLEKLVTTEFLSAHLNETFTNLANRKNTIRFYEQKFRCCLFDTLDEFRTANRSSDSNCPASMTCLTQIANNSRILIREIRIFFIVTAILIFFSYLLEHYLSLYFKSYRSLLSAADNDNEPDHNLKTSSSL